MIVKFYDLTTNPECN